MNQVGRDIVVFDIFGEAAFLIECEPVVAFAVCASAEDFLVGEDEDFSHGINDADEDDLELANIALRDNSPAIFADFEE